MKIFITLSFALVFHTLATAQNIPDTMFAYSIRLACPVCIDSSDNLTPAADTLTYLEVTNNLISDLSGVEGFDNLQTFVASNSFVDSLPALPASLRTLSVAYNRLRNIDNVLNLPNLEILDVNFNQLSALPLLPNTIKQLTALSNGISQVQNWPTQLVYLDISYNQLSGLIPLGDSLRYLNVSFNLIDSLHIIGGDNLQTLFAFHNGMEYINRLPDQLRRVNVEDNLLPALPPLPFSLVEIKANYNLIDTIHRLNHIRGLRRLELVGNQLHNLPDLPDNIEDVYVNGNFLTSLPPLPPSVSSVFFGNNQISQWPSMGDSIRVIYAYNNLLTSVDFLPAALQDLSIYDNPQLSCLPAIPNSLLFLTATNTNINCLVNPSPTQVIDFGLPACDSVNNTNNCFIVGVENTSAPTFIISPNPCQNYLTVQNSDLLDDNSQLYLYNNLGQLVKQQQLFSNSENIDVSELQPAVYYLVIKTPKGSFSQKIVKQ